MTTYLDRIATALRRRSLYVRTARELRGLDIDTALDLDIYRGDAGRIAHRAVYGA